MSWKTASEIVVFMVGAAVVGLLIGFIVGVQSKLARSWSASARSARSEVHRVQEEHQQQSELLHAEIRRLSGELALALEERQQWIISHHHLAEQLERVEVLTPAVLEHAPDVRAMLEAQLARQNALSAGTPE